jgi:Inorganic Pyrophosphatase
LRSARLGLRRIKFSNAASASDAVAEAAEARKGAIDGYQKSVAGKFLGLTAPEDVTKTVGGIFGAKDAVRQMSMLARQVKSNPEAAEGLRKAVADTILAKAKGTTESGTSGIDGLSPSGLKKFLHDNVAAIKTAGFSDREFGSMLAVAQDPQRGQRTLTATRLSGQSNMAQDIVKAIEAGHAAHPVSLLNKLALGAMGGFETHGWAGVGAALGLGEHLLAAKRMSGLAKANTLVRDAMVNPELAMALLKRAPNKPGLGSEAVLTKLLARNSMFGSTTAARESNRPQQTAPAYSTGGRVAVNPTPTEAQKTAGNYQKAHIRIHGLDISIENPKGSYRTGVHAARPDAGRLRLHQGDDGSGRRPRRLFHRSG